MFETSQIILDRHGLISSFALLDQFDYICVQSNSKIIYLNTLVTCYGLVSNDYVEKSKLEITMIR